MTKGLRGKIAALRAVAPELNKATDEAAALVQAVDVLLGDELSIGVAAESSDFGSRARVDDDGKRLWVVATLAYGRVAGRHRLHVREVTWALDADGQRDYTIGTEETPWSSCPRDVKLKSFQKLPELLGEIADRAGAMILESRATAGAVRELMDALRIAPASGAGKTIEVECGGCGRTMTTASPLFPGTTCYCPKCSLLACRDAAEADEDDDDDA